ncbi:putative protein TPRXL [Octopus bimaculoides]|uniref:DM domain-containing protein n=1 Tax=Octopus bimaculoides TaxID=37653 RepID=A0A0L8GBC2_OCTBM|nr:putative protein TPRXL [Octopus bimaculoides]|eukprot:XP_014782618.1 PREDICTED: putative protein TPRXL [Octopus bimaculoides]
MNRKKVYPTSYRNPKCSRCRNHGFDAKMKGHKGCCPYILCNCMKCILVEERRRISRQQILLQRHPDINVKDIFKGCIRCEKFCQQVTDYSNCVTADSFMPSPNTYPVVQQISGNQSVPSVNLPLNLQMSSTQPPPPSHIYSSSPQPDFGYYTPKTSFAISNYPAATSSKMSDVHSSNSNISSSSSSSNSSSSTTTTTTTATSTTSANNTMYYTPAQVATNGVANSEYSPSYIYPSNGYQLARAPQNLGFGNYNRPSLFWNTFNYPVNSWPQKFCDNSVPSNANKVQIPENLSFKSADNPLKSCKLAADTTK